jgi:Tol biopolymer transport system component
LKKEITTLFLEKITIAATTNIHSKRIRRVLDSQVPARFAFLFAISAILLLPSLSVMQINQSAWAGTFPGPNGQIAFSSNRDGNFEIYSMNDDGSDVTRLTDNDANDFDPSWSPDGEKIAFVSFRDGSNNMEIYVMNADGSDQTRLTDNDDALDREPSWSPDGEKIAFVSDRDSTGEGDEVGDVNAIYSLDADDGSDVTRLTDTDVPLDSHPTWSPDGDRIAFVSFRDGNNEIYSLDADDGSDVTRLTDDARNDLYPTWSPDGEKIAFVSDRDSTGEGDEIYSLDADDGSDVTRLTDNDADDREHDWGTNTSTPGDDNGDDDDDDDKNKHDSK